MKRRLTIGCWVLVLSAFALRATVTNETQLPRAAEWARAHADPWKARFAESAGQAWHRGVEFAASTQHQLTRGCASVKARLLLLMGGEQSSTTGQTLPPPQSHFTADDAAAPGDEPDGAESIHLHQEDRGICDAQIGNCG